MNAALAAAIEALGAERLTPVPREHSTVAVDRADLASLIGYLAQDRRRQSLPPATASALGYVRHLEDTRAAALDMLSRFTPTSDGHRARVGQVQISRWEEQLRISR